MGRALSRDSGDRVVADVNGALSSDERPNGSETARCAFPINRPDRERRQRCAGSAITVRLPITGPSAFLTLSPFSGQSCRKIRISRG